MGNNTVDSGCAPLSSVRPRRVGWAHVALGSLLLVSWGCAGGDGQRAASGNPVGPTAANAVGSTAGNVSGSARQVCSMAVDAEQASVEAAAGELVAVITAPGCAWTAMAQDDWIRVTGGQSGDTSGEVHIAFDANASGARVGTVAIQSTADAVGTTITVAQAAATCQFDVGSTARTSPPLGGPDSITVTLAGGPESCAWTAVSENPFIRLTAPLSGVGAGMVAFVVDPNPGAARSGTLVVAGQTIEITQAVGCTYAVTPTSVTVGGEGGGGRISVVTDAECLWTVIRREGWIDIETDSPTESASGTGGGTFSYSVRRNDDLSSPRSGSMTVAGEGISIEQRAGERREAESPAPAPSPDPAPEPGVPAPAPAPAVLCSTCHGAGHAASVKSGSLWVAH
jgi:trimeric autotransporter adhesin